MKKHAIKLKTFAAMKLPVILVIFTVHCATGTYPIHIGESFIKDGHVGSFHGETQIQSLPPQTEFATTGVYSERQLFMDAYPVVRTYHPNTGLTYTPLAKKLDCAEGSLMHVNGKIIAIPIQYPRIKKTVSYHVLEAASFRITADTRDMAQRVTREYLSIRENLERQIRSNDSNLSLSIKPNWLNWYDESNGQYLMTFFQYDLMYAAAIEFIVNDETGKIESVWAKQWFKGEL